MTLVTATSDPEVTATGEQNLEPKPETRTLVAPLRKSDDEVQQAIVAEQARLEKAQAEAEARSEVVTATARACLSKLPSTPQLLAAEQLVARWKTVRECFAADGSEDLALQKGAFPQAVALYGPRRLPLRMRYSCSDLCPTYGGVAPDLSLSAEDCRGEGLIPVYDPAWGGYRGCKPTELASSYERAKALRRKHRAEAQSNP